MHRDEHLTSLERDGQRIADLAETTELSRRVPTCPDWDLGDLVEHLGFVHRWQTAVVRDAPDGFPDGSTWRFGPDQGQSPAAWLRAGVDDARRVLAAVDPDAPRWTWAASPGRAAWYARRLAQETLVHRIDAELTAGVPVGPVPPAFAIDGIDEMCDVFLPAAAGQPIGGDGRSLRLHATDAGGAWRLTLHADRVDVARDQREGDATIAGRALDLLLVLWGREPLDPIDTFGDSTVVDTFRAAAKI